MKIKRINIGNGGKVAMSIRVKLNADKPYTIPAPNEKQRLRIMPTYIPNDNNIEFKDGRFTIKTNGFGIIGFSNMGELESCAEKYGGYPYSFCLRKDNTKLELISFRFIPFSIYYFMEKNYTIKQCNDGYIVTDNKEIIARLPSAETMNYTTALYEYFIGVFLPHRGKFIDDWELEFIKTNQKLKYDKIKRKYCKDVLNHSTK